MSTLAVALIVAVGLIAFAALGYGIHVGRTLRKTQRHVRLLEVEIDARFELHDGRPLRAASPERRRERLRVVDGGA